jgi:hypothetical protein
LLPKKEILLLSILNVDNKRMNTGQNILMPDTMLQEQRVSGCEYLLTPVDGGGGGGKHLLFKMLSALFA